MDYLKQLKIEYIKTDIPNPIRGQVEKPEDIYVLFKDMERSDKEKVVGVYLDARMLINSFEVVSIGSNNLALVAPKEVCKGAILTNSPNFIVLHNHPSGDPEPSPRDRRVIIQLQSAAKALDLRLIDFIIIGDGRYWSYKIGEYFAKD